MNPNTIIFCQCSHFPHIPTICKQTITLNVSLFIFVFALVFVIVVGVIVRFSKPGSPNYWPESHEHNYKVASGTIHNFSPTTLHKNTHMQDIAYSIPQDLPFF